jgi:hypothetical protein
LVAPVSCFKEIKCEDTVVLQDCLEVHISSNCTVSNIDLKIKPRRKFGYIVLRKRADQENKIRITEMNM